MPKKNLPQKKRETLRPKAGQTLIIGFAEADISPRLRSLLTSVQPAGVILFARNIVSAKQTRQLLKDCQACVSTPLFTCVDMEGGTVDRFRKLNGGAPSAADVFATGNPALYRQHGKIIGGFCRSLGFNTDFAPVLDLAFDASKKVMQSRAVAVDPRKTVMYAGEFLAGLRDAGVLGCGKHFPGLGEGDLDSHHQLPVIEKSAEKLWAEDILPYRMLSRQMPFVLVSHAGYPRITGDNRPASLSKNVVAGMLRKRVGYNGLVVSDDLEMGAVLNTVSIEQAVVEHIAAGGDLCLICHSEELILKAQEALIRRGERDRRFRDRLDAASHHVIRRKRAMLGSIAWKFPPSPAPARLARLSRELEDFRQQVGARALP